jgi:hypothetical protein
MNLHDCIAIAGAGLLTYGLWLIYPPAAFIVVGVLLLGAALFGLLYIDWRERERMRGRNE